MRGGGPVTGTAKARASGSRRTACAAGALLTLVTASPVWASSDPIFASGFESGSTCPWSVTSPARVHCWGSASGDWSDASSWRDYIVPPPNSDVAIDVAGGAPQVTLTRGSVVVHDLVIDEDFSIQAGTLTIQGRAAITAPLTLGSSTSARLTASGTAASVVVTGPVRDPAPGRFEADDGGTIVVESPFPAERSPRIEVTNGGSFIAPATVALANSSVDASGALSVIDLPNVVAIENVFIQASHGARLTLPRVTSAICRSVDASSDEGEVVANGDGAIVSLPALRTLTTADCDARMRAQGGTSRVELPALDTLAFAGEASVTFTAYQGFLDLCSLPSLSTGATLEVLGGTVDVASLTSIEGGAVTTDSGAALDLPGVTHLTGATVSVSDGSLSLPSVTDAPDSVISVEPGGGLAAGPLHSLTHGAIFVRGAGVDVSFPALTNLDDTLVAANEGASLSFPALVTYRSGRITNQGETPCGGMEEICARSDGATIHMPSLRTVIAQQTVNILTYQDGGLIDLPVLDTIETENGGSVYLSSFQTRAPISVPSLRTLPEGCYLEAGSGGLVKAPSLEVIAGTLLTDGFPTGPPSVVDAPSVNRILGSIEVTNADLSFPLVTSVVGAKLDAQTNGSITLANLTTATASSLRAEGGRLFLPALTGAPRTTLQASYGGTVVADALASLTAGTIEVSGYPTSLTLPALTDIDDTLLSAFDGGALLSLPAVESYTFSGDRCPNDCIEVSALAGSAIIDLPHLALVTSTGPALDFLAGGSSSRDEEIHLPALTTIEAPAPGAVSFTAWGLGSVIDLTGLTTYPPGTVTFTKKLGGQILR